MPTNLDAAIGKLSDKAVQARIRSAIRSAALDALKKEGIELSPQEWGELFARMITARSVPIQPDGIDWGSIISTALPILASLF